MNNLTKVLLGSVAVSALAIAPAMAAKHPHMAVTAIHAGKVVNKSKATHPGAAHITYTYYAYTYQPASAAKKTHLAATYYRWLTSASFCANLPGQKIKAVKKSTYAKVGTATETYTCSGNPVTFYGQTWTNKTGVSGETDFTSSTLFGKFHYNGNKYKGALTLDAFVFIE